MLVKLLFPRGELVGIEFPAVPQKGDKLHFKHPVEATYTVAKLLWEVRHLTVTPHLTLTCDDPLPPKVKPARFVAPKQQRVKV